MKAVYQCDVCKSLYDTEDEALACDTSHPDLRAFQITHAHYDSLNSLYGSNLGWTRATPKSLKVQLSNRRGDYGIYVLSQYGPKGL